MKLSKEIIFLTLINVFLINCKSGIQSKKIHTTQSIDTSYWKIEFTTTKNKRDTLIQKYLSKSNSDSMLVTKYKNRVYKIEGFHNFSDTFVSIVGYEYFRNGRIKRNYSRGRAGFLSTDLYYYNDKFSALKDQYHYVDGKLNGLSYSYYPAKSYLKPQKIKSIANYKDGLLEGKTTFFRKNGTLWQVWIFSNDNREKIYFYNKNEEFNGCLGCIPIDSIKP